MLKGSSRQRSVARSGAAVVGLALASFGTGCTSSSREANLASASRWSDLAVAQDPLHALPNYLNIDLSRTDAPQFSGNRDADFEAIQGFLGAVQTKDLCSALQTSPQAAESLWAIIERNRLSELKATLLISYLAVHMSDQVAEIMNELAGSSFMIQASDHEAAQYFVLLGEAAPYGRLCDMASLAKVQGKQGPLLLDADSSGRSLLHSLYGVVASESCHKPLAADRPSILFDLVSLACGERVLDQGDRRTCGSTAVLLALNDLPEMARLALGLLSPAGVVSLKGGKFLVRTSDWDEEVSGLRDFAGRGAAQALLQSALMDFGNGPLWTYRDSLDTNLLGILPIPGLMPESARLCMEQLTGARYEVTNRFDRLLRAHHQASQDLRTLVVVDFGGFRYHWITLETLQGGDALFFDPNGRALTVEDGVCTRYEEFPMQVVVGGKGEEVAGKFRVSVAALEQRFFAAVVPVLELETQGPKSIP